MSMQIEGFGAARPLCGYAGRNERVIHKYIKKWPEDDHMYEQICMYE